MGTSGNRDCQWASRSVLKDFTEDAYCEGKLATARTTSLLVELVGVAAFPFAGWMCEGGRHGEFQETMGNVEHGYWVSTDSPACKGE